MKSEDGGSLNRHVHVQLALDDALHKQQTAANYPGA